MKRTYFLFFILMAILTVNLKAQTPTIDLVFLTDLSSLDLSAFALERNLSNQQKIFQVLIQPEGVNAYLEGKVDWQESLTSGSREVVNFRTKIFRTRSFFSDELGSANDLLLEDRTIDNNLLEDIIRRGKLTGIIRITLRLFSENGQFMDDSFKEIVLLNPAPTISINLPQTGSQFDVGNVPLQWTPVSGVLRYLLKANTYAEGVESPTAALNSGTPIIDDFDAGVATSINLATVTKTREWYGGQKVVVIVKAVISESGRETVLNSEPVTFELVQSGGTGLPNTVEPDANMVRLAEIVKDNVASDFLTKLKDGTINMSNVQIIDENNVPLTPATFLIVLSFLEANNSLIVSKTFIPKS
ncbi:MAG: hypothetical protein A2499_07090 [Stygiobacter sp. RIFOXYC12_FULL_38_8]|nr:MAG: hypothetical protein A2299_11575 [Stygiobacter sp. RIFOXYB2_FULL_37_11]OGV14124.1 MAG: hypothetical protein A2237_13295 [Stygiobacter sp. RIFOXYA2_FULL_38_8]OGV16288.1 MAG: hypothetical protein A2440_04480 [Stygiobacter sp. RIFOXYC2_FULL_38_25]OGV26722.1 MAG: hypothetical protein A2499_07090 [Stygiobacter sp. RIFOXYC12_FULL_38_8]OGV81619.1 MAG: hypothetical protein A2X65_15355 [Stygiobacter sp. GWF2_38_21]RJQ61850.1 MAG: hypothetical protein C4517_07635 [Stygiobacter sp.]